MRRLASTLALVLIALCLGAIPMAAQAPEGPITPQPGVTLQHIPPAARTRLKTQVTLVNTPVTVRNSQGEMIHDLESKDFRVTDNGVPQQITHFDLGGDPLSLVLLIESSSRIDPLLPEMRKTGILFSEQVLGPSGEAAVVSFNDSVDKLLDFTGNHDEVEKTILHLGGGTSGSKLYDAMAVGVEMLSGRPQATPQQPGRRRVLLIMAEAHDVGSEAKLGEVLRRAQLANVTIYSIGLSTTRAELQAKPREHGPSPITPPGTFGRPPLPGTVQTPTTEAQRDANIDLLALAVWAVQHAKDQIMDHALEVAAAATGGAHLATYKDRSIEKAIDEIGGELHSQYSLSYTPTGANDIGYHEIKISLIRSDAKNLKVRARPGYYLAAPET
jgi:VWFA-related protein